MTNRDELSQRSRERIQAREEKERMADKMRTALVDETGQELDERKIQLLLYVLGENIRGVTGDLVAANYMADMFYQKGHTSATLPRKIIDVEHDIIDRHQNEPRQDKTLDKVLKALIAIEEEYELVGNLSNPECYGYVAFYLPAKRKIILATNDKNNSIFFIHLPEDEDIKPSEFLHRRKTDLKLMQLEGLVTFLDSKVAPRFLPDAIAGELDKPNPSLVGRTEVTPNDIVEREKGRLLQLSDDNVVTENILSAKYKVRAWRSILQRLAEPLGKSADPQAVNTVWRYALDSLNRVQLCLDPEIAILLIAEVEAEDGRSWHKFHSIAKRLRTRGLVFIESHLRKLLDQYADESPADKKISRKTNPRSPVIYLYRERIVLKAMRQIEKENTYVSPRQISVRCKAEGFGIRPTTVNEIITETFLALPPEVQVEYKVTIGKVVRYHPDFADMIVDKIKASKSKN